ncbi:MAG: hypothetical protein GY827_03280 [Cytophagales bacterium]|nr:hypothetical protein [Cytophagales bacterium]
MRRNALILGCLLAGFSMMGQSVEEVKESFSEQEPLTITTEFGNFSANLNKIESTSLFTYYFGELANEEGTVEFNIHENRLAGEIVSGHHTIVIQDTEQGRVAKRYHNDGAHCDFEKPKEKQERVINDATIPAGVNVNQLESNPSADYILYLDMDGEIVTDPHWINQSNRDQLVDGKGVVNDPNISDQVKYQIWQTVSEDYQPFNINVTTNRAVFESKNYDKTQMVIIGTENNNWLKFSDAGVARVGGFTASNSPCFAFTGGVGKGAKNLGEVSSHEAGHTFGLLHDGVNSSGYYEGHGNWAPIMGVAYYKDVSQWSKCEYQNGSDESFPFSGVNQDDVQMITNVSGFRVDDHANTTTNASLLITDNGTVNKESNWGVIETANDVDVFEFTTNGGAVNITFEGAKPLSNLDIEVKLLNANGNVINTFNNPNNLSVTVNTQLASGTYYLQVDGVGEGNPLNTGYSDYASLGYYEISGTISNVVAAPFISFTSPVDNQKIELSSLVEQVLVVEANAEAGVKEIVFVIEGEELTAQLIKGVYTANWLPNSYGKYTVEAQITDNNDVTNS